ncbi:MAG: EthD domain-containing protein [Pseudomonadales bacterium]
MIRITFLLRAKSGLPKSEFYDYWLNQHGPLVASVAGDLNMLRYVQVHTLQDEEAQLANKGMADARGGMELPYDGVAEVYFENREQLLAGLATDAGKKAGALLVADEAKFIDLASSPLWLGYEYPQVNATPENLVATTHSNLVKLYFPLRAQRELGEDAAQAYWRHNHGPIIRRQADCSGIMRYVQVHRADDELEAQLRSGRGTAVEPYTGHAELWFDRSVLGQATPERRAAGARAITDESTFIDFPRSAIWLAKEHVFVDHR